MEDLKGKKIIERMNQLIAYGKTKTTVQEGRNWGDVEYTIKAPNGTTYGIIRDNAKFYLKETTVENPTIKDFDFIGGVINGSKRYYTNYSHALNYLNLMITEMNSKNPKSKGINLLEFDNSSSYPEYPKMTNLEEKNKEKEVDEKTVLKMPKAEPAPAPAPAPAPEASAKPADDGGLDLGDEKPADDGGLDLGDETSADDDLDLGGDENLGDDEETKQIQKLTGKLGQAMRDKEEPDNDLTKYVVNSVMSSLKLSELEPTDQKQILKKMKKKMAGEGELEDTDNLNLGDDTGDGSGEEDMDLGLDKNTDGFTGDNETQPKKEKDLAECDAPYGEKKEPQNIKTASAPFNEKPKNIKTEGRVRKTITRYFEETPAERQMKSDNFVTESISKVQLITEGKSKCKSIEQELALTKVLNYDNGFQIKTMKENVIVETKHRVNIGGKEYQKLLMVETNGRCSGILKDVETKEARQYRMVDKKDYLNFINLGR